jgi:multidrug resistance efflux pump
MSNVKAFWTAALMALALSIMSGCSRSDATTNTNANNQPTIVEVSTAQAVIRSIPTYFEATGNLVSDASTDVAPAVSGKIVAVNFDIGSYLNQGDVMLRLDDRDARIKLEQTQSQLQQSQSAVMQAEAQAEQARANVRQAQAQLGLSENERFDINSVAEVRNAKAALDLAELEFNRASRLIESGDLSRSLYDQRRTQRDQAKSAFDTALNSANQRYAAIYRSFA